MVLLKSIELDAQELRRRPLAKILVVSEESGGLVWSCKGRLSGPVRESDGRERSVG